MQGYSLGLAERVDGNFLYFTARLLDKSGEGSPTRPQILRPEPVKPTSEYRGDRIYASDTGWVACIRGNQLALAYNTRTRKTYGGGDLNKLSPFFLIDSDDRSHLSDVNDLRSLLSDSKPVSGASPLDGEFSRRKDEHADRGQRASQNDGAAAA
jgi:hypothetical protein